jgi:hypothetical protein
MNQIEQSVIDRLPITINGSEKYATGLNKRTTIDDIKFAMLTVTEPTFKPDQLEEYGIFERWQGNERLLEGKIKIYKLVRLWQSLPGDQLSQVQFIIKKKKTQQIKMAFRDSNIVEQQIKHNHQHVCKPKQEEAKKFAFCTLSPAMQKTWNLEKARRKTSYLKKRLAQLGDESTLSSSICSSSSDVDEDLNSSENEYNKYQSNKRYASIRSINRSKRSTVKQTQEIKKSFIELVNKQNQIIDKQLTKMTDLESTLSTKSALKQQFKSFIRSRSFDKSASQQFKPVRECSADSLAQPNGASELIVSDNDVKLAFDHLTQSNNLNDYTRVCNAYLNVDNSLEQKQKQINHLKTELKSFNHQTIEKANRKLRASIETGVKQEEQLSNLNNALSRIDDIIALKSKFIQSLEDELKRIEYEEQHQQVARPVEIKKSLSTYNSTSSTTSTSSSVFTSVSSAANVNPNYQSQMSLKCYANADNESDTGISSANSDDFSSQQLETLV